MPLPVTASRAGLAAAALACGALLLSACGSSGGSAAAAPTVTKTVTATAQATTSAPPATGSSMSPRVTGPAGCTTAGLSVKLGAANGAAGSSFIPIVFTNTSGSSCSLFGYPGVSFVTGQGGSQIGSAAARVATQPADNIVLAAGGVASASLRVAVAQNFPAACQLTTASTLKIFPPGQTAPLYISFTSKTCASTSPADQILYIQTVGAGNGAS